MNEDFEVVEAKPPIAVRIRQFFETLFTGRLVLQLRADLDEARSQRDYFKGRAERLELLLTQPRVANRDLSTAAGTEQRPAHSAVVGGRKTWQQIIADRRKELAQLALDKAAAKSNGNKAETSAPAKPAQN